MQDRLKIGIGLAAFLLVALFPFIWTNAMGRGAAMPDLEPAKEGSSCVGPEETMREDHVRILKQWRDDAVRSGDRFYTGRDGIVREKSLTSTCLDCHGEPAAFCDACHEWSAVSIDCWDCHVAEAGK